MPENTAVTASLVFPTPLPPDQDCPPNSMNAILESVANNLTIQSTTPDSPSGQTDSTAQLALNTANTALTQIASVQASVPARRTSGSNLLPLAGGDNSYALAWSPDMPNTNYNVIVTVHGPGSATISPLVPIVVDSSRTLAGCQIRFLNVPNTGAWSFTYAVEAL